MTKFAPEHLTDEEIKQINPDGLDFLTTALLATIKDKDNQLHDKRGEVAKLREEKESLERQLKGAEALYLRANGPSGLG